MIVKPLQQPHELLLLRILKKRLKTFSQEDSYRLQAIEKGYEGELQFQQLAKSLPNSWLQFYDLLLEKGQSISQIDSLIFTPHNILLFEIKNYEGDFVLEDNLLLKKHSREVQNPMTQLTKTSSHLRQFLNDKKLNHQPISSFVIFINPEFHLYQADTANSSFVFPTQLKRFMATLQKPATKISSAFLQISDVLLSQHLQINPFTRLPKFTEPELQKGIYCFYCGSSILKFSYNQINCENCTKDEHLDLAIYRTIEEYRTLFPAEKITTIKMSKWLNNASISDRTIRRILLKFYHQLGQGRNSYYVKE
ncbi:nuclease-related domain-containing protein [Alkalihalobacillus sp. 1P02AB]|uniref:nuclease-related domain-containing protein n=1 Tax=Alkalihalobacillus sp. 1P02AB TaxID=3132260 RepID=UPI0039A51FD8